MAALDDKRPIDGLHVLKDKWRQKSYLKEYAQCLSASLEDAINATYEAAPSVRLQGYQLGRLETREIDETERERLWERSIFRRWSQPGLSPVGNSWDQIIAYQVPLFSCREKKRWGYIDLLGIRSNGVPSVLELKKEPSVSPSGMTGASETPLRMILEAGAYAIALRKNWDSFRPEFITRLNQLGLSQTADRVPTSLTKVNLVCIAPASFWIDWLPITAKGSQISADTWKAFNELLSQFKRHHLPVTFVSISGDVTVPGSLAAQPLQHFPGFTTNQVGTGEFPG